MAKYVMALDAGTTSNRCILFNERGDVSGDVKSGEGRGRRIDYLCLPQNKSFTSKASFIKKSKVKSKKYLHFPLSHDKIGTCENKRWSSVTIHVLRTSNISKEVPK